MALWVSDSSSAAREKPPNRAVASKACNALRLGMPFLMLLESVIVSLTHKIVQFYQLQCANDEHILTSTL
jgi:hypothetical protein